MPVGALGSCGRGPHLRPSHAPMGSDPVTPPHPPLSSRRFLTADSNPLRQVGVINPPASTIGTAVPEP